MHMMRVSLYVTVTLAALGTAQDLKTVTIAARNDFQVARPCLKTCLYGNGDVAPAAGCVYPYYNKCWCSSNIAASATSYISTCVTKLCSDNVDVSTAIAIYDDYCSGAGSPIAGAAVAHVATSVDLKTVTIAARNDFQVMRPCVKTCLYGNGDVAPAAGCVYPYYNQCWCSSNIAASATSYISTCVTKLCSDNVDVSTAVFVYSDYCSGAGYPIAGAPAAHFTSVSVQAGTTTALSSEMTTLLTVSSQVMTTVISISTSAAPGPTVSPHLPTSAATATSPNLPAATSSPSNSNLSSSTPANSQPSAGEIVGIVFAVLVAAAILMALWYYFKHHYPRRPRTFAPPIQPPTPPMSNISYAQPLSRSLPSTQPPSYSHGVPSVAH